MGRKWRVNNSLWIYVQLVRLAAWCWILHFGIIGKGFRCLFKLYIRSVQYVLKIRMLWLNLNFYLFQQMMVEPRGKKENGVRNTLEKTPGYFSGMWSSQWLQSFPFRRKLVTRYNFEIGVKFVRKFTSTTILFAELTVSVQTISLTIGF